MKTGLTLVKELFTHIVREIERESTTKREEKELKGKEGSQVIMQ